MRIEEFQMGGHCADQQPASDEEGGKLAASFGKEKRVEYNEAQWCPEVRSLEHMLVLGSRPS